MKTHQLFCDFTDAAYGVLILRRLCPIFATNSCIDVRFDITDNNSANQLMHQRWWKHCCHSNISHAQPDYLDTRSLWIIALPFISYFSEYFDVDMNTLHVLPNGMQFRYMYQKVYNRYRNYENLNCLKNVMLAPWLILELLLVRFETYY